MSLDTNKYLQRLEAGLAAGLAVLLDGFAQLRTDFEELEDSVIAINGFLFLRFFVVHSLLGDEFAPRHAPRLWNMRSLNCGLSIFEQGEQYRDWERKV